MFRKRFILLLIFCGWLSGSYAAYTPETVPQPWLAGTSRFVCNPDNILTITEENDIVSLAEQLHETLQVEVATVAISDIGQADAYTFAVQLFNRWGIGDKKTNQGVLILLVTDSRDIQIITGGGVEGLLPDAQCAYIVQEVMIPLLRDGDYGKGLMAGNQAIAKILTTDAAKAELLLGYRPEEVTEAPYSVFAGMCLGLIVLALLVYFGRKKCPNCHRRNVRVREEIKEHATFLTEGTGVRHCTCESCQHYWRETYTIPRKTPVVFVGGGHHGGTSGGFGRGFGGGMTFGGGAGGKF